jgi:hypothetical protein
MSDLSMSKFASLTDYKAALKERQAAKKVVQYDSAVFFTDWNGDRRAEVVPVDHPDTVRVSNGRPATTSIVLNSDEVSGCFETEYTIYVPAGVKVVDTDDEI